MKQSQLVGKKESPKGAVGAIKRRKITVPHFDNTALIKGYAKTLIGRCMNPSQQDVKALILMLPKIWKMEDQVVGADLGLGRFQFDFDKEEEIETVLKMQPFHFDYWMLSLVRWQPFGAKNYPSEIIFWVRVLGVPLQIKVRIDGFQSLCLETTVDLQGGELYEGEELTVSLKYEKLFGYCRTCTTGNVGSISGRKLLCVENHSAPFPTLTAPVIIGLALVIVIFIYAMVNHTTIALFIM
ncbi:hypothetical protein Bca52824_017267 [Brassica carinata]|uniref:DUF4283 domain-containing protein n=1 Tax=Brassica carinata TaxID=52824 RepID=A0A8X7VNQ8_BRACI|nr:hypothetical protein Bca52824_017267 [Brassica carinata]